LEGEDLFAIFTLQEQLFSSSKYTENFLETGIKLKANNPSAPLNIKGLQKLPLILTYIKKK